MCLYVIYSVFICYVYLLWFLKKKMNIMFDVLRDV